MIHLFALKFDNNIISSEYTQTSIHNIPLYQKKFVYPWNEFKEMTIMYNMNVGNAHRQIVSHPCQYFDNNMEMKMV